ncbi:hypothetical protein CROQUDRAFT_662994 [Cronartium quercuum f. sp. fusiforme G11]|uniref:C2H2-type domain-containing protein n=1 Tax=Cronartium quercuum f. sp. fusiforme G11 TaxID=708437 RepID=A0A9P6T7L1_9BASI|nr:hypothetical protein CROQUDRAFT_662994 [Cronartium quercuum f. sp. fusiforme G11]
MNESQPTPHIDNTAIKTPIKRIRKKPSTILQRSRQPSGMTKHSSPQSISQRKRLSTIVNHHHNIEEDENDQSLEDFPMIRCGWNNCQKGFWILEDLLEHLVGENGHIPLDPNAPRGQKCPCEWNGCSKAGKPQGSRMALLVHLRSHTGEKPFCCHKPECDKTFSRTDALAKHVRVSHGESLPSGRKSSIGFNLMKKVKGEETDLEEVEMIDEINVKEEKEDLLKIILNHNSKLFDDEIDSNFRNKEERKSLDELKIKFPSTDPDFLEMVIMRSKLKFLLGEREILDSELKALELKERSIKKQKDSYLDLIMKQQLGPESSEMWRQNIDNINSIPTTPTTSNNLLINQNQDINHNRTLSLNNPPVKSSNVHLRKRIKTEPGL